MYAAAVGLFLSLGAGLKVAEAPSVVVLHTRASPEIGQREKKLYDALTLALDAFAVMLTPPDRDDFAGLTLPEQVSLALPQTETTGVGAVAVVWLVRPAPRQVMVHLVARNTGRTLVKTVETTSGPDAEATLALVVKELLGAAFLFEPPASLPPGLGPVVQSVRTQVAPPQPAAPAPPPVEVEKRVAVAPMHRVVAVGAGRFGGQVGGPLRAGLHAAFGAFVWERLVLSATVELGVGPLEAGISALEGTAGMDAFFPLGVTRAFGPYASVAAGARWQRGVTPTGSSQALTFAGSVHGGVRSLVRLSESLHLCLDLGLGIRPLPTRLVQGDTVFWREGWAEVRTGIGIAWEVR